MGYRMRVENPGAAHPAAKKRTKRMAKKKTKRNPKRKARKNPKRVAAGRKAARARARNPKRTHARKRNPKRTHARKRNPKRTHARKRNPKKNAASHRPRRRNAHRRRRHNPGWSNVKSAFFAALAGGAAALGSSWINDGPLGNASPTTQNLALVAEAAAAVYWLEDPVILGGVVVGLTLVPVANLFYSLLPGMANPGPMMGPPAGGVVVVSDGSMGPAANGNGNGGAAVVTMSALHRKSVAALRHVDKKMATLHRGSIGALHTGIAALHRGKVATLHRAAVGTLHANVGALHAASGARSTMRALGPNRAENARQFSRYGR